MKVYSIDTPEKLKTASSMIKWERDRRRVQAFVNDWEKSCKAPKITLELSRNAHVFTEENGKKSLLATLYIAGAREFVKELNKA